MSRKKEWKFTRLNIDKGHITRIKEMDITQLKTIQQNFLKELEEN